MATYKVIQDIEAEDKLLGPLSLKQFIFAAISVAFAFVAFFIASNTVIYAAIPFLPFIIVPAILAAPLSKEQPTDVWLAARVRFFLKPRKRIWDQSGIKELVTITAPKKVVKHYSNGLSQLEVRSRLGALADTIDSRGWAVKNVDLNLYTTPALMSNSSDRLLDPTALPQSVSEIDISASDDILDATSNPIAQQLDTMMKQSGQAQKQVAINRMQAAMHKKPSKPANDYSFLNQQPANIPTNFATFTADPVVIPGQQKTEAPTYLDNNKTSTSDEEQALLEKIKKDKARNKHTNNPHHKTIKTPEQIEAEEQERKKQKTEPKNVTPPKNPVNIELAKNASDLKISTVAGLAKNKANQHEGEIRIQH
jgi:PrgI family protein